MTSVELNLDGLVGPTHHYGGLSHGNLASSRHRSQASNPRAAALEGLAKMKLLVSLGIPQALLPPQPRPALGWLRNLGFSGTDGAVLEKAQRASPTLVTAAYSASSMWTANAATVTPSRDAADGRVHFTPANLSGRIHRALETEWTGRILNRIFPPGKHFVHHPPVRPGDPFGDEGAANHTRLCPRHGARGVHLFAFGRRALSPNPQGPRRFPARQSLEASQAVARSHAIAPRQTLFLQQNPAAIDAGAFHNDVVAVGNEYFFLHHGRAYVNGKKAVDSLRRRFSSAAGRRLAVYCVSEKELPLREAVQTYLFNSQIVTLPKGGMALIAPGECETGRARRVIDRMMDNTAIPVTEAHFVPLRQSMRNGGGPACLRLRVTLNDREFKAMHRGVILTPALYGRLTAWVERHYRDRLASNDLRDIHFAREVQSALGELAEILDLPLIS